MLPHIRLLTLQPGQNAGSSESNRTSYKAQGAAATYPDHVQVDYQCVAFTHCASPNQIIHATVQSLWPSLRPRNQRHMRNPSPPEQWMAGTGGSGKLGRTREPKPERPKSMTFYDLPCFDTVCKNGEGMDGMDRQQVASTLTPSNMPGLHCFRWTWPGS